LFSSFLLSSVIKARILVYLFWDKSEVMARFKLNLKFCDDGVMLKFVAGVLLIALMMGAAGTCGKLLNFYQTRRRSIPEDCHLHCRRRENLTPHTRIKTFGKPIVIRIKCRSLPLHHRVGPFFMFVVTKLWACLYLTHTMFCMELSLTRYPPCIVSILYEHLPTNKEEIETSASYTQNNRCYIQLYRSGIGKLLSTSS
jgi:hypothetical protein